MDSLMKPMSKTYIDKPLTNFPVSEDTFERMMDVSITLYPLIKEYNEYYAAGNLSACNNLLANNPELQSCLFNAEKYNRLRDAILAIENFLLTQIEDVYTNVVQNAIGINDNVTGAESVLVAYSAQKVNQLLENAVNQLHESYHTYTNINIPVSGWNDTYPYLNTVNVNGVTTDSDVRVVGIHIPEDATQTQIKAINKAAGFLVENDDGVGNGTITFKAYKKPAVDFTVIIDGKG